VGLSGNRGRTRRAAATTAARPVAGASASASDPGLGSDLGKFDDPEQPVFEPRADGPLDLADPLAVGFGGPSGGGTVAEPAAARILESAALYTLYVPARSW
jgi:hypothetical protein